MPGEFPAQKASNAEMFPFDDVIIMLHHANDSVDNDCISCLLIFFFQ